MGSAPSILPLLYLAAGAVALAVLLGWAWRWKKQSIPPTCRRCGYDVSRRPEGVERCSECGADLTTPKAIVTVRGGRNWWVVAPSSVLIVLLLAGLGSRAAKFPWTEWICRNASLTQIEFLAKHNRGSSGDVFRLEWWNRAVPVSPDLIDHLLDVQGDASIPGNVQWQRTLAAALESKQMNEAQIDRLLRQTFGKPTFHLPLRVRQGDPLVVTVDWPTRNPLMWCRCLVAAQADGVAKVDIDRLASNGGDRSPVRRLLLPQIWGGATLAPGTHRVDLAMAGEIIGLRFGSRAPAISPRVEYHDQFEIEVLPKGAPLGEAIRDEGRANEVARAVGLYALRSYCMYAKIRLLPAGVDRAFIAYAVIDGKEVRIGEVAAQKGSEQTTDWLQVPVGMDRVYSIKELTIVLVGDGEALKTTLGQEKFWAGRIVYPTVPVQTYVAEKGPTTLPYRIEDAGVIR